LLWSTYIVDFKERIKEEESSSVGKSKSLNSLKVAISCGKSSNSKTILKKIHAFRQSTLMVTNSGQNRPETSDTRDLVEEKQIHLTVIGLKVVSIIAIQNDSIDPPLIIMNTTLFFLLSLLKNIIESIIKRFIVFLNDWSPVRYHCKSKWQIDLNRAFNTVGISTSNSSEG